MLKHGLFMKIYLWFWLATIILFITGIIVDRATESGPGEHFRKRVGQELSAYGRFAVNILERESTSSMLAFLSPVEEATDTKYFIFGPDGREVTGRKPPDEVLKLVAQVAKTPSDQLPLFGDMGIAVQRFVSQSGKEYLISEKKGRPPLSPPIPPLPHPPHPPPFSGNPYSLPLKIIAVLAVSGIVCYILTRYLISPLVELSRATRQLAGGNLSVRVRSVIGKRKDEISQLAEDFDLMAERVEALMTSQRSLLRDVSHELRSPLTRLYVALELCQQRLNPEDAKSLERITREADKLSELIGQILNLNRVESGVSGLEKNREDLRQLIQEIVDDANFEAKKLNRAVRLLSGDACMIMGNRMLLQRAIENVVRNAVRYTADGSEVEISVRRAENDDSLISVSVRDHGPGIPESEIANLFKPFYRYANSGDDMASGAGLGLTIAEAAVRIHGGTIRAANAHGGGLFVEMAFPVY
ncbi:MAG: Adaptive-response sensory-kinase SasA [Syntrophus sp. SKADARSKE-3]|nr:Adaptive-response sensory-kinase SasA [Syntrophus sp. SKADARSKE-3]